jgi:Na+-translocating ferredoxin:NAD+ oxidoreductase RnfG subunit
MINQIIFFLLTKIGTALLTWTLSNRAKKMQKAIDEKEVDQRLQRVKEAYTDALDGKPVTPEQRKELNKAFSDFVRSSPSSDSL